MKTILIIIFSIASFCFLSSKATNSITSDNIVIKFKTINNNDKIYIENDLMDLNGIKSFRVSVESNSIFIQYDSSNFNFNYIYGIFDKWNLIPL